MLPFFLPALFPLFLLGWLLAQPRRYCFRPFLLGLPIPDWLAGPLFLLLPLVLFLALLWVSPRWRWVWLVLLVPYGPLARALVQLEGWFGLAGGDSRLLPPWGTLSLVRTPQELYLIGRSWLLESHPRVSPAAAETAQVVLANGCRDSQTLEQLHSQLEIISSILVRMEPTVLAAASPFWWLSGIPLLASTYAFVDFLILSDFPADPKLRAGTHLLWLGWSVFAYYGIPLLFQPELIPLVFGPLPVPELVSLADWLAPVLPPGGKGSLTGKTAVSKTAIGGSNPPPSVLLFSAK